MWVLFFSWLAEVSSACFLVWLSHHAHHRRSQLHAPVANIHLVIVSTSFSSSLHYLAHHLLSCQHWHPQHNEDIFIMFYIVLILRALALLLCSFFSLSWSAWSSLDHRFDIFGIILFFCSSSSFLSALASSAYCWHLHRILHCFYISCVVLLACSFLHYPGHHDLLLFIHRSVGCLTHYHQHQWAIISI